MMYNWAYVILPLTLLIPYSVQFASNVSPAQCVLFELYSHCFGGLLRDGFGSTPAKANSFTVI